MARRKGADTPLPTAHPALEPDVIALMLCSLGQLPLWFYIYKAKDAHSQLPSSGVRVLRMAKFAHRRL
jgi:hypothetical protein